MIEVKEPMRGLYLDCFSGISGDMMLGALVDLGVGIDHLRRELGKLSVRGFSISARPAKSARLGGTKVDVEVTARQPERGLHEIRAILARSRVSPAVRDRALAAFERLVRAEARVHRIPAGKVHLHEVGAVDAIVDITGTMIGMEALGWPRVVCSPLHVGRGFVSMAHGTFPVPPPAVTELLRGRPIYSTHVEGELVTPTGAALVTTLATDFGVLPSMRVQKVGYGAGSRQYDGHPNLLRLLYGELLNEAAVRETVVVIQTTIDDMNPQLYGHLMERLFAAGALEVFYAPIQMKKNRPGTMATVIVPEPRLEAITEVIFRETTTIGFRYLPMGRIEMARRFETAPTPWGPVRMKISVYNGEVMQATPEYEDCRALALKAGVPLKEVQRAAVAALPRRPARRTREARRPRAARRTRAAGRAGRSRRTRR
jgi:uncharacterized protein (TIGR00299 family) protein